MAKTTKNILASAHQKPQKISHVEEEKFMAIMKQIDNSLDNLSGDHISEVINQRGKIADYIHEENMQEHERFKLIQRNSLIQLCFLLGFAVIVLVLTAVVDKSYLLQSLTLIIGFIGGFGLGKTLKEPSNKKE